MKTKLVIDVDSSLQTEFSIEISTMENSHLHQNSFEPHHQNHSTDIFQFIKKYLLCYHGVLWPWWAVKIGDRRSALYAPWADRTTIADKQHQTQTSFSDPWHCHLCGTCLPISIYIPWRGIARVPLWLSAETGDETCAIAIERCAKARLNFLLCVFQHSIYSWWDRVLDVFN